MCQPPSEYKAGQQGVSPPSEAALREGAWLRSAECPLERLWALATRVGIHTLGDSGDSELESIYVGRLGVGIHLRWATRSWNPSTLGDSELESHLRWATRSWNPSTDSELESSTLGDSRVGNPSTLGDSELESIYVGRLGVGIHLLVYTILPNHFPLSSLLHGSLSLILLHLSPLPYLDVLPPPPSLLPTLSRRVSPFQHFTAIPLGFFTSHSVRFRPSLPPSLSSFRFLPSFLSSFVSSSLPSIFSSVLPFFVLPPYLPSFLLSFLSSSVHSFLPPSLTSTLPTHFILSFAILPLPSPCVFLSFLALSHVPLRRLPLSRFHSSRTGNEEGRDPRSLPQDFRGEGATHNRLQIPWREGHGTKDVGGGGKTRRVDEEKVSHEECTEQKETERMGKGKKYEVKQGEAEQ
ncbi:hypothetical protein C7M84_022490 [Penaeus vannamei]|uniref:Uncharacterized protein n=1 Tax=Penaeus vannamei TaxID=6689 RepID=A0A3R7MKT1_PENVA|nr:hypothetical protein C7M84_022490 [Penaeus vannamei]